MDAPTKLATFLRSAANGEVDEVPTSTAEALRFIFSIRRGLLGKLEQTPAADVDNALEETARLALSLRSDELDELTTIETAVLDDLLRTRRRALAAVSSDELGDIERARGGMVLGVDVD